MMRQWLLGWITLITLPTSTLHNFAMNIFIICLPVYNNWCRITMVWSMSVAQTPHKPTHTSLTLYIMYTWSYKPAQGMVKNCLLWVYTCFWNTSSFPLVIINKQLRSFETWLEFWILTETRNCWQNKPNFHAIAKDLKMKATLEKL